MGADNDCAEIVQAKLWADNKAYNQTLTYLLRKTR